MSQDVHLNSIQVPSQPIQVSRFVSSLHPGSQIHVSSLSHLNLTSIWVLIFTYRLHPGNISPPPRPTNLQIIMSISCMDLVKECERKHKDQLLFHTIECALVVKDVFFIYKALQKIEYKNHWCFPYLYSVNNLESE